VGREGTSGKRGYQWEKRVLVGREGTSGKGSISGKREYRWEEMGQEGGKNLSFETIIKLTSVSNLFRIRQ